MSKLSEDLRNCTYCNCTVDHVSEALELEAKAEAYDRMMATQKTFYDAEKRAAEAERKLAAVREIMLRGPKYWAHADKILHILDGDT